MLAEAGYLDGLKATTHWRHAGHLREQCPAIDVQADAIFVEAGRISTSAGVTAGIDLALALVEANCGSGIARDAARELVVFMRRPGGQSQFAAPVMTPRIADDGFHKVMDLVRTTPQDRHSVADLARHLGVSARQLGRWFQGQLGTTPAKAVASVRIAVARGMLEAGESVTSAAMRSGLGSDETLRRLFLSTYGVGPSAYQKRFRSTGDPKAL